MGMTLRHFLFEEDGTIRRIPQRVIDGLVFGKDAIPAYAGTRQRVLNVILENEDRKLQAFTSANGFYFEFDAAGYIDEALRRSAAEVMDLMPDFNEDQNVVALSRRRKKKEWRELNRWQPTANDLDRVLADIIRRPGTKAFASVDGLAPRRPPLTYEAKSAINELRSKHSMWNWEIKNLSEKALPGFIWEARSQGAEEPEDEFFWQAVAAEGERQQELQRLRRTGKGQWIAVVRIFTHESHSSVSEAYVEHRECAGEAVAIEALQGLIAKHSGKVGRAMSIEARTMPALEWKLLNGAPY